MSGSAGKVAESYQSDIGVIALEDAGIYQWLGALGRDKQIIADWSPPPVRWDDIGYSVAAAKEAIADMLSTPEWRSVQAVGFSTFGQIDRHEKTLMAVPREEWQGEKKFPLSFRELVRKTRATRIPLLVEHDVTVCALAEWAMGNHEKPDYLEEDKRLFGYVRVGAGVGVEILREGLVLHEKRRGESGHIPIHIDPQMDKLRKPTCKEHKHCLEGYISTRALAKRSGMSEEEKADLLGNYIGQLMASFTMFTMPYTIVLAGTSMLNSDGMPNYTLYDKVRRGCASWLGGYPVYRPQADLEQYIRQASMPVEHAAITGAALLAKKMIGQ